MHESLPTEVFVDTKTPSKPLGSIVVATVLEAQPQTVLSSNTSACCEDCPDVNDNPPSQSECPNFEVIENGWPVCTRDGNSDQQLNQFFLNQ